MRVVIADDSGPIRDLWRSWVASLGHEVVAYVGNGLDAIAACEEHKPDLALLDMSMPHLNGDAAAKIILEKGAASRVLIASSMVSMQRTLEAKGIAFIAKPISSARSLGQKINEVCNA